MNGTAYYDLQVLKKVSLCFFLLVIVATVAPAAPVKTGGIWANSPVGKCYDSLEHYLLTTFGEGYKDDANIQVANAFEESEVYKWIRDVTPGVKITRVLFRVENDRRACAVLFVPLASTVREIRGKDAGILLKAIIATDSPPPGFPESEVVFRLDGKKQIYRVDQCFKRPPGKKKKKGRGVDDVHAR